MRVLQGGMQVRVFSRNDSVVPRRRRVVPAASTVAACLVATIAIGGCASSSNTADGMPAAPYLRHRRTRVTRHESASLVAVLSSGPRVGPADGDSSSASRSVASTCRRGAVTDFDV